MNTQLAYKYLRFRYVWVSLFLLQALVIGLLLFSIHKRISSVNDVKGAVTVVPVHKEFLVTAPSIELQYFYESKPNVVQHEEYPETSRSATYTINSDALNERFNYAVPKPPDVYRIIVLGDSFTFGHYVNTNENWVEQLEDMLNKNCFIGTARKIEVINLGERGYDVLYAAHKLYTRGLKYEPDSIIYFESGTGFNRVRELFGPFLDNNLNEVGYSIGNNSTNQSDVYAQAWEKTLVDIKNIYSPEEINNEIKNAWVELLAIRGDIPLMILGYKDMDMVNVAKLELWMFGEKNVTLARPVRHLEKGKTLFPDAHPNVNGHALMASDIFDYLKNSYGLCEKN